MIGKGRVSSFKELSGEGTKTNAGTVEIIFVHGLAANRVTSIRRAQKDWLRELSKTTKSRISIFGFNAAELLTGGKERLILLASELHKNVLQLQVGGSSLQPTKLVFIGHGLAGWVVQESLSRHPAADIAWHTKGVIFLGLPSCKNEADWDEFSQHFINVYTKTTNLKCKLKFSSLKLVAANFESLRTSSYGSRVGDVPMSSTNAFPNSAAEIPHGERYHIARRGTFSSRSGGSDSILGETDAYELSLLNVKAEDKNYMRVVSFFKDAVAYEKSEPNFKTKSEQLVDHPTLSQDSQLSSLSTAASVPGNPRSSKFFRRGSSILFFPEDPPSQEQASNDSENMAKNENESLERQVKGVNEMVRFAALYQQSGELLKARALYEAAKAEIAKGGTPSDPSLIGIIDIIKSQLAVMELLGGHLKDAEKILTEIEPRLRSRFGDHERTWEVARWLAVSFDMQGQYGKARQKLEQVLGTKDVPGPESYTEAAKLKLLTKSTLALVIGHLGDYKEATSLSYMALGSAARADMRRATEIGDVKESASLGRMLTAIEFDRANILACVGQLNQASSINDKALRGMERYYGNKHVATLDCWSLKAHLLALQGRIDDAEEQCQKTLRAMRREIGKEHPSALRTLGISVFICKKRARLADALQTANYIVEKNQESFDIGPQHPQTIESMALLADVHLARGQLEQALSDQRKLVELSQRALGPYHPTTLSYKSDLANIYCGKEYWDIAGVILHEVFLRQYKIYLCMLGVSDKIDIGERLPTAAGRVEDLKSMGDKLRAILESLKSDDQTCDDIYFPLITTMHRLAVFEREREDGDLELTRELLTRVEKYRKFRLRADHEDTLAAQLDLALTDRKEGHVDVAAEIIEDITKIRRGLLGPDHPDTLTARHELIVTKIQSGSEFSDDDIVHEQEEILQLRMRVLGKGHPDTIQSRISLSSFFYSIDNLGAAETLQLDALKAQIDLYPSPTLEDEEKKFYEAALKAVELIPKIESNGTNADTVHLKVTEGSEPMHLPKSPNDCHPQVISSLAALASIYNDKEDYAKAATLQEVVVSQHKRLHGKRDHPATLQSMVTLAQIHQNLDNTSTAIELYKTILTRVPRLSPMYFDTQSLLGSLYFSSANFDAAKEIQSQAYMEQNAKYEADGEDPEALVIAIYNLALTKKAFAETSEAMELLRKAVAVGRVGLGSESQRVLEVSDTLHEWAREDEEDRVVGNGAVVENGVRREE